jgi:hypothetical protein
MTSRIAGPVASPSWGPPPSASSRGEPLTTDRVWKDERPGLLASAAARGAAWLRNLRHARAVPVPGRWQLHRDATLALDGGRAGLVLQSHAGTFVVTQEGDVYDHVLAAGGRLATARRGRVVAWALSDGTLGAARP